jgi:hypothetical protein
MAGRRGQQKTHSRFQPWVLVKITSISTSANGIAGYDDYQNYLSNLIKHVPPRIAGRRPSSSPVCQLPWPLMG